MPKADRVLHGEMLEMVAERFRLLGDPTRLLLLGTLGEGEMPVQEIVVRTGLNQANVSKHLQLLTRAGLLARRKQGLFVYYRVADPQIFDLCDTVCGSITEHQARRMSALEGFASVASAPTAGKKKAARTVKGNTKGKKSRGA
ncbi:MAG: ArsR/SmtB family transcription factor [Candidatus Eisenbacteria bacterium]